MMGMTSFGELWSLVQQVKPGGPLEPATLQLGLQASRDAFLELHRYKGPNAQSAAQIQSGRVVSPKFGEVTIDPEPDMRLIKKLSNDLALDEVHCLELLTYAHEMWGNYSLEAGVGVHFKERYDAAQCLARLLCLQLFHQLAGQPTDATAARQLYPLLAVVIEFNNQLLKDPENNLIRRIIAVIKDASLEFTREGIDKTQDQYGTLAPRDSWLVMERTLLCQALLYAVHLSQEVLKAETVQELVDLVDYTSVRLKSPAGGVVTHALQQQAYTVLFAALHALLREDYSPPVISGLKVYTQDQTLQQKLTPDAALDNSYHAVLLLAWGLLREAAAPGGAAGAGGAAAAATPRELLDTAGKQGALTLLASILKSTSFRMEVEEEHKQLCAITVYRLVTELLVFDNLTKRGVSNRLMEASSRQCRLSNGAGTPAAAAGAGGGGPLMRQMSITLYNPAPFTPSGAQQHQQQQQHDDMSSLLNVLAAVFRTLPGLWYDGMAVESYQLVSGLMSFLAVNPVVHKLASVFVGFLGVMEALAVGHQGAHFIAVQFRENTSKSELEMFTWGRLFKMINVECARYRELESRALVAGGPLTGRLTASDESLMDAGTEAKLVAYLTLFAKVIREGADQEILSELTALERTLHPVLQGASMSEPFFQVMCHGVPSSVKAASSGVLTAMARFKDAAGMLLERLLQCAVVNDPGAGMMTAEGFAATPRFDMVTQMSEVEARQEDYSETLSLIRLINKLLEVVGPTIPGGAPGLAQYTRFILLHVLGPLGSRGYKIPAQKWQLAAECLRHCKLMLQLIPGIYQITDEVLARPPPGLLIMEDLLTGEVVMKGLGIILGPGYMELGVAMEVGDEGLPRQDSVAAAFELLNLALEQDQPLAAALNARAQREQFQSLERRLVRAPPKQQDQQQAAWLQPPRHQNQPQTPNIHTLMPYVHYSISPEIQLQAIKFATHMAARLPQLVDLLLPNAAEEEAIELRNGYATCLSTALGQLQEGEEQPEVELGAEATGNGTSSSSGASGDQRADGILDLMLGSLTTVPAPALGHLMLGFDITRPPAEWHMHKLMPRHEFSCLTVILDQLQNAPDLHLLKPGLYTKCLQLVYLLCQDSFTAESIATQFLPSNFGEHLLPRLASLLAQPLPTTSAADGQTAAADGQSRFPNDVHVKVAALRQRAFTLKLYSQMLLQCQQGEFLEQLLTALFRREDTDEAFGGWGGLGGGGLGFRPGMDGLVPTLLQLLPVVCREDPPEGSLSEILMQDEIIVNGFSIVKLLSQPAAMQSQGLVSEDITGQPIFDFGVLNQLLVQWRDAFASQRGQQVAAAGAQAHAAAESVLKYAQQQNAHSLWSGAQEAVVHAWRQTVEIIFTKNYSVLNQLLSGQAPELLHYTLRLLLQQLRELANRGRTRLAELLAGCCRVLLSKLQELGSSGEGLGLMDPLNRVHHPSQCLELLRLILEALRAGARHRILRCEMYAALLQYLMFCRGSKLSSLPPLVLSNLLQGLGPGVNVGQLDSRQLELELGNAAELRRHKDVLVRTLAGDALQPVTRGGSAQAVALHLLGALIGADRGTDIAAEIWQANIPQAILKSIPVEPYTVLMKPASQSKAALHVVEAQLGLLLRLANAGSGVSRKSSAKLVRDAGALPILSACQALDCRPEQLSILTKAKQEGTLRQRLYQIVTPVLRLVLMLLVSAPGSQSVRAEAAAFVATHDQLMLRLLQEAAAAGPHGAEPGNAELEQAVLSVKLLSQLSAMFKDPRSPAQALKPQIWALWSLFCGLEARDGSSSHMSPLVYRIRAGFSEHLAPSVRRQQRWRLGQLLSLRGDLARLLFGLVSPSDGGPGELLVCTGIANQPTMDAHGRPTLLLLRDTAQQALMDLTPLAEDLEDLLVFARTPGNLLSDADVAQKLRDWGPYDTLGVPALPGPNDTGSTAAAAVAALGLDPIASRQMARTAAATGAATLLSQMRQQVELLECCCAVVLLHFLQCVPHPDLDNQAAAAAADATEDAMMEDATLASGALLQLAVPKATRKDMAKLGTPQDLQFLAGKLRDVCTGVEDVSSQLRKVLGGEGEGGAWGQAAAGQVGVEEYMATLDSLELVNRQLKLFLNYY